MNSETELHSQNKYRSKQHEALLKLKTAQKNIDMMQRRFKYLQVRDEANKSKTIQHEKKLNMHYLYREQIKRQQSRLNKEQMKRLREIQLSKQKNLSLKEKIEDNIKSAKDKVLQDKEEEVKIGKEQRVVNEEIVEKFKQKEIKNRQDRRRMITQKEQQQKINFSRYHEGKRNQILNSKSIDSSRIFDMAGSIQKQLEKLSKMEEEMIKKSSESLQASQMVRNRLREVLGDERRFTKLPQIRTKNNSTRGSTGNTHIISI